MRRILDKMFLNKPFSFVIPIAIAMLMYVLFVLFGTAQDKVRLMIITPIVSLVWLFGVFFVLFVQVKNASCSERFLNVVEWLATIVFGIGAIVSSVSFVASGFQNFTIGICPCIVTYSAISWAHSKR